MVHKRTTLYVTHVLRNISIKSFEHYIVTISLLSLQRRNCFIQVLHGDILVTRGCRQHDTLGKVEARSGDATIEGAGNMPTIDEKFDGLHQHSCYILRALAKERNRWASISGLFTRVNVKFAQHAMSTLTGTVCSNKISVVSILNTKNPFKGTRNVATIDEEFDGLYIHSYTQIAYAKERYRWPSIFWVTYPCECQVCPKYRAETSSPSKPFKIHKSPKYSENMIQF